MGEHHDVAQYMLEQGALSITGIQDLAALSIQVSSSYHFFFIQVYLHNIGFVGVEILAK